MRFLTKTDYLSAQKLQELAGASMVCLLLHPLTKTKPDNTQICFQKCSRVLVFIPEAYEYKIYVEVLDDFLQNIHGTDTIPSSSKIICHQDAVAFFEFEISGEMSIFRTIFRYLSRETKGLFVFDKISENVLVIEEDTERNLLCEVRLRPRYASLYNEREKRETFLNSVFVRNYPEAEIFYSWAYVFVFLLLLTLFLCIPVREDIDMEKNIFLGCNVFGNAFYAIPAIVYPCIHRAIDWVLCYKIVA